MKASDKPELSAQWWTKAKPDSFNGGKELTKALTETGKVIDHAIKGDAKSLDAGVKELEQLRQAVHKTINKECDKKKDRDLISVLEGYNHVIDDRIKQLYKDGARRPEDLAGATRGANRNSEFRR